MKQVLQAIRGGRTRVADVPAPVLSEGGVLVRTRWSLISPGTERMVIELAGKSLLGKARERPDHVRKTLEKLRRDGVVATYRAVMGKLSGDEPLGYSAAGEVLEVGRGVSGIVAGDRVACAGRRYAGHAEVLCVPRNLCARVPEGVDLRHASAATLGAIALQGVRTAGARLGETAVVVGLGLLGQLACQLLRSSGVRVVAVDRDPERAALAGRLGVEVALVDGAEAEAAVHGMTAGHGADVALVCAASNSSEPLALAARLCRKGGVVTLVGKVGMELDHGLFYVRELTLRMSTSYGPGRYDPAYEERGLDYPYPYVRWTEGRNLEAFLELLRAGSLDLDPLLTHEFGIEDAEAAYDLVTGEKAEPSLGILLRYDRPVEAALAPPPAVAAPKPKGEVGIGFLGAGQFASAVLLPNLSGARGTHLDAVATSSGATADAVARRFGIRKVAASAAELVADPDVGAVVITTRHDSHARLVIACLDAGKPCFVEKPLVVHPEELEEVLEAMTRKPGLVCVGFNRRFAPAVEALRTALASRTVPLHLRYRVSAGKLPAGHWTRDPEIGGGRIVGEACHFVDLLAHVAASPVARVHAEAAGDDGAVATLRLADGSTAVLEYLSFAAPALPKEHLEVHVGGSSYLLDDFRSLSRREGGKTRTLWSGAQDKGHATELTAWAAAVTGGGTSPVPFDEAVASTVATFAVLESIATGTAIDVGD